MVCDACWLVQTEDHAGRELLFTEDYAYFSSFSDSWLRHSESYVSQMIERFGLTAANTVVEVAANDGYLLQYVARAGIPNYGIEPTASTAAAARAKGIDIVEQFFGVALAKELARQGRSADLMAANNVLAHVPDINDFVGGFAALLTPTGIATFEFPHLLRMVADNQFDTAYHEHYSYLSLTAVTRIFNANGLRVWDVETINTHGGSLRVFAQLSEAARAVSPRVNDMLAREKAAGIDTIAYYAGFQAKAEKVKHDFTSFLIKQHQAGRTVAAYGAAAKGNTLMNFAGIRPDLISYVVDRNPAKADNYMPGSRIPIVGEERLRETQPDLIVILPWNLTDEIVSQLAYVRSWGGRFVRAVPTLEVL
jgi:SAM-dependent methyltransferase